MAEVADKIIEWASTLPYWEQVALDYLLAGESIKEVQIDEIVDYLLEDADLIPRSLNRPKLCHLSQNAAPFNKTSERIWLKRIYNLTNINALVPNQVLEFGHNLTVIFGANGSGKSGYARVIGSAAYTRGDRQVLPNVLLSSPAAGKLSADIDIEDSDGQITSISYVIGESCPQLNSIYVFDSTSVRSHLTRENPMSFSPAGLHILTELADVIDRVRTCIDERCEQKKGKGPEIFLQLLIGESEIKRFIENLGLTSKISVLEEMVSDQDLQAKLDAIELKIAQIRNQQIQEQITHLAREISDLEGLTKNLSAIWTTYADESLVELLNLLRTWQAQSTLAAQIDSENFNQSYDQIWEDFIRAAFVYGQTKGQDYPSIGDRCILCNQPLSGEAHDLLHKFWQHLTSNIQAQLTSTQNKLSEFVARANQIDLNCLDSDTVINRYLSLEFPSLLADLQNFLNACAERQELIVQSVAQHQIVQFPTISVPPIDEIDKKISQLQANRQELLDKNIEQELTNLEHERTGLQHSIIIKNKLDEIREYIENAKWIQLAIKERPNTRHITQKYNELFKALVTDHYVKLFEQTLADLNCPLTVQVTARGDKGSTIKHIVLARSDSNAKAEASPEKVLSEGEQRAVALADFLTEVTLDEESCGIVLDDPVTSLDFEWKEIIAQRIVRQASSRQVIVFTHDLHFFSKIMGYATDANIPTDTHWIERRNAQPGWIFLNNSRAYEDRYKTTKLAEQVLSEVSSPTCPPQEMERLLKEGFGALRTCYEALVIYEIFGGVVLRFGERISVERLKDAVVTDEIVAEVIQKIGDLSRFIEGHLHSDEYVAQKPTSETLAKEIKEFAALKKKIRDMREARKKSIK